MRIPHLLVSAPDQVIQKIKETVILNLVSSTQIIMSPFNVQINFMRNSAGNGGTELYGGNLDNCRLRIGGGIIDSCGNSIGGTYSNIPTIDTIQEFSNIVSIDNSISNISSDPVQICLCVDDGLFCNYFSIETVRGKEFTLMVVVVGQNKGIIPSAVRTSLDNTIYIQISTTQRIQSTEKTCTPIRYRLSSVRNSYDRSAMLVLFPDGPCRDTGISRREIKVRFLPCPDAFTLRDG